MISIPVLVALVFAFVFCALATVGWFFRPETTTDSRIRLIALALAIWFGVQIFSGYHR